MRYLGAWAEDWLGVRGPAGLWAQSPWGTQAGGRSGVSGLAGF